MMGIMVMYLRKFLIMMLKRIPLPLTKWMIVTKKMKPVKMVFNGSAAQQQMKEQHTAATSDLVMLDKAIVNGNDEKKPKAVQSKKIMGYDGPFDPVAIEGIDPKNYLESLHKDMISPKY